MVAFFLYKNTLCNVCKIKMQEQEITSDEIYENSSIVDFTITGYKNDENHFILQNQETHSAGRQDYWRQYLQGTHFLISCMSK